MKTLYVALSALFGATPGFVVMWTGIRTPPDYNYLFGGVIQAVGCLALVLLWMNRVRIRRIDPKKVTRNAIVLGICAFLSIAVYLFLFNLCVVSHSTNKTVFFPLWTTGDLAVLIEDAGGRWKVLDLHGFTGIQNEIDALPFYLMPLTVVILLFVYQAIFTTFTIAFGLVGFHKQEALKVIGQDSHQAS